MTHRLVKVTLETPSGDPAEGYVDATATQRRHVDGDPDVIVLPGRERSWFGEALEYTDDADVEQTAPATPGVAWLWLDATNEGAEAGLWAWSFREWVSGGGRRTILVPAGGTTLDYGDAEDVDPDTLEPGAEPGPAWDIALDVVDAALQAEILLARNANNLTSGQVPDARIPATIARDTEVAAAIATAIGDLLGGAPGALDTLNELAAALGDDENFAANLTATLAAHTAALAAEALLARDASNLTSGTIDDARIPTGITRDSELAGALAALVASAPGTLDTLNELAAALGNDPNYAATIAAALGTKATTAAVDLKANTADVYAKAAADARTLVLGDARYLRTKTATVIDLGNSIASNGTLSYYDRTSSGAISFGALSYMGWAMPKTSGRFRCKGVSAIGGYTMEQIIAELLTPAIAAAPDYIHLQVFTNNLAGIIAGTQTFAQAQALYTTMTDALVAAGIIPIIATVPPINTVTNSGTGLTVLTKINLWLKRLASAHGWPLVDYHAALIDPATNNYVAAYTSDGVHMTGAGAKVMGEVLAATMNAEPSHSRSPLWASYNPNLMQPDACTTSAAADKWVGSGGTGGGWAFKSIQCPAWKGNSYIITRGSISDYSISAPINTALWVAGHTVRVAFQFDASAIPAGGSWSVQLYNATQAQVVCGFTAMTDTLTHKSVTQTGCTTTSGSKVVTGAPAGTFKPEHVGCGLSAVGTTGLLSAFPANTVVTNVSADGTTVYASANATDSRAGISVVTISGPQPVAVFEFEVQADMVGDNIYPIATVSGVAGATLNPSQVTIQDITALGVAA